MNKIATILYVHGFNGSGTGSTATTIAKLLPDDGRINFITHDFSNKVEDISKNINTINELVKTHHPPIIIASSLGAFETMHAIGGVIKMLINPTFDPSINLPKLVEVSDEAIQQIKELGMPEFDYEDKNQIFGFFGSRDEVCNYQKEFREIFGENYMTIVDDGHKFSEDNLKIVVDKAVELVDNMIKSFYAIKEIERKEIEAMMRGDDDGWTMRI